MIQVQPHGGLRVRAAFASHADMRSLHRLRGGGGSGPPNPASADYLRRNMPRAIQTGRRWSAGRGAGVGEARTPALDALQPRTQDVSPVDHRMRSAVDFLEGDDYTPLSSDTADTAAVADEFQANPIPTKKNLSADVAATAGPGDQWAAEMELQHMDLSIDDPDVPLDTFDAPTAIDNLFNGSGIIYTNLELPASVLRFCPKVTAAQVFTFVELHVGWRLSAFYVCLLVVFSVNKVLFRFLTLIQVVLYSLSMQTLCLPIHTFTGRRMSPSHASIDFT